MSGDSPFLLLLLSRGSWEAEGAVFTRICMSFLFIQIQVLFGEGNGKPIQYSCLENPKDGGAW